MTGESLRPILLAIDESLAKVARRLSMTPQNLDGILKTKDIKTGLIEKLSREYSKPVSYFFQESVEIREAGRDYVERGKIEHKGPEYNGGVAETELREQISLLKSQLEDKERIIRLLEERER